MAGMLPPSLWQLAQCWYRIGPTVELNDGVGLSAAVATGDTRRAGAAARLQAVKTTRCRMEVPERSGAANDMTCIRQYRHEQRADQISQHPDAHDEGKLINLVTRNQHPLTPLQPHIVDERRQPAECRPVYEAHEAEQVVPSEAPRKHPCCAEDIAVEEDVRFTGGDQHVLGRGRQRQQLRPQHEGLQDEPGARSEEHTSEL